MRRGMSLIEGEGDKLTLKPSKKQAKEKGCK